VSNIVDMRADLYSPRVDYFRCRACGYWWMVDKNVDEPATRIVFAVPTVSANSKKTG
jgi:hypothetical protein